MKILFLIKLLIFSGVVTKVVAQSDDDYCNPKLCKAKGPHVACRNPGVSDTVLLLKCVQIFVKKINFEFFFKKWRKDFKFSSSKFFELKIFCVAVKKICLLI